MKTVVFGAIAALSLAATPALAQPPAQATASAAAEAPAGKLSVSKSKISEVIKNPAAKAALEKALPQIAEYYDQIGDMTLADVAPMSQGALNEESLKALQVEFDKLP